MDYLAILTTSNEEPHNYKVVGLVKSYYFHINFVITQVGVHVPADPPQDREQALYRRIRLVDTVTVYTAE
jgi:hypothetical protein